MSELPKGWVEAELGSISDVQLGKMLDKQKNKGSPQPYLRNVNVRWGAFDLSDVQEMRFTVDETSFFEIRNGVSNP